MDVLTIQWGWIGGKPKIGVIPPVPLVPPIPETVAVEEPRRWPGPSIVIYRETDIIPTWQRKREDEEIILL